VNSLYDCEANDKNFLVNFPKTNFLERFLPVFFAPSATDRMAGTSVEQPTQRHMFRGGWAALRSNKVAFPFFAIRVQRPDNLIICLKNQLLKPLALRLSI
jgi:hypothetical protein